MNRPFLKAGLIGGAALVIITLSGLIPVVGCVSLPLTVIAYVAVGSLAAYWLSPRREAGPAAGQGALAGLIAGLISGLVNAILTPLGLAMSGGTETLIAQLPPETLQQLEQAGIDPAALFGGGTLAGVTLLCCLPAGLLLGAGLGALGGVILAAAKPE